MIELRYRELLNGIRVLEYTTYICQLDENGHPNTSLPPVLAKWRQVPHMDKNGVQQIVDEDTGLMIDV